MDEHIGEYFAAACTLAARLDYAAIKRLVAELTSVRARHGRVYVLGLGGSAANASHMVNDLRKLCEIEAYAPTDNASELTARANDEGVDNLFVPYLKTSRLCNYDAVLVLSVGGGDSDRKISTSLVAAVDYAKHVSARVLAIVGRSEGYAAQRADAAVIIPAPEPWITPLAESFQALIWHCLVSHPQLQRCQTAW